MSDPEEKDLCQLLVKLPADVRVRKYFECAAQAFMRAADSDEPEIRARLQSMGSAWYVLALETQHTVGMRHSQRSFDDDSDDASQTGELFADF